MGLEELLQLLSSNTLGDVADVCPRGLKAGNNLSDLVTVRQLDLDVLVNVGREYLGLASDWDLHKFPWRKLVVFSDQYIKGVGHVQTRRIRDPRAHMSTRSPCHTLLSATLCTPFHAEVWDVGVAVQEVLVGSTLCLGSQET